MKILIAGELNVDLLLQNYRSFPSLGREVLVEDASLTLGSSSAICAAGLAKLGNEVAFAGRLGCDSWGDFCLESLKQRGIDCSLVVRDPLLKTGITVSITSQKDRALVTYLGAIAELRASDIPDESLKACRHLHVSSFFLQKALRPDVRSLLRRAHDNGLTTSLDPGFDPFEGWENDLFDALAEIDIFLPNEIELGAITGERDRTKALQALENGRTVTVAKLGAEGCMAIEDRRIISVPAFEVVPVDTTGAGDSFNAGFLHSWLHSKKLQEAMRFGAACGSLSTLCTGGTTCQPTEAEVEEFIASRSGKSTVSSQVGSL